MDTLIFLAYCKVNSKSHTPRAEWPTSDTSAVSPPFISSFSFSFRNLVLANADNVVVTTTRNQPLHFFRTLLHCLPFILLLSTHSPILSFSHDVAQVIAATQHFSHRLVIHTSL